MGFIDVVMFNPVIVSKHDMYETEEGCLSLDGVRKTTRYQKIEVEYYDFNWKKQRQKLSGWTAQICQHEIDHLSGKIIYKNVDCEVAGMLKNVLIVVDDIEKSIEFYRDLFGLQVILQNEGNVILSEGLVLQDAGLWGKTLDEISTPFNNRMELYFEEFDIDGLLAKYESGKYFVRYATELTELAGAQKLVRLYDPSGNLIEVRTPFMSN